VIKIVVIVEDAFPNRYFHFDFIKKHKPNS